MCGRFQQSKLADELRAHYGVTTASLEWTPSFNVAPTDLAPVVTESPEGQRDLRLMRFGQTLHRDGKPFLLINRQSEKVAGSRALAGQRCIIPVTAFYEWQALPEGKQPWCYTPTPDALFSLAGLWTDTEHGPGFTILTIHANPLVAPVHHRMPVILGHNAVSLWLAPSTAKETLSALLEPYTEVRMQATRVSTWVNNAKHKDAQCAKPL